MQVSLIDRDPIWSVNVENVEILVGMLAVGVVIIGELNKKMGKEYYMTTNEDISDYRLLRDIEFDDIKFISKDKLYEGEYGIWIKSNVDTYFNLYRFNTNYFFQGLISICTFFSVDFRNYLYGYPFDGYGNLYSLSGYIMTPYMIVQDVHDLDDVEEEEKDDENIIEPFERSDEIITIKG